MAVDCPSTVSSPPLRLPLVVRLVLVALAVVVVAFALDRLGVAGYQGGELLVPAILALTSGLGVWSALRGRPSRVVWTAAAAVLATVLTPVLVDRAPWSVGRLQAELDGLVLPFTEVVDEDTSGTSWCVPRCPRVSRTYLGPAITPLAAAREVASALTTAGVAPVALASRVTDGSFDAEGDDLRVLVRAEPDSDEPLSRVRVTITLQSRR
jgi:hypothetical protein